MKLYAVKEGRNPGIYETWEERKRIITQLQKNAWKRRGSGKIPKPKE